MRWMLACAGVLVLAAPSLAQVEAAPLAGPKIAKPAAAPRSIVSVDLDGTVRRPPGSPEEAAARLLTLDVDTRARVDAVFAERGRELESFIENNLDLILRLMTAENAPGREKLALLGEALNKTEPLRRGGPLDRRVRALLPADQARVFDRLLKEYWDAIATEDKRLAKPKGRLGAAIDEKFKSLGREAEAAYKRCERSGAILYHYLFDSIGVMPEQEKPLRALCAGYAMNGLDNKDKKAQAVMLAGLMQVLTPEQGAALARKFKGEGGYKKRPGKPAR